MHHLYLCGFIPESLLVDWHNLDDISFSRLAWTTSLYHRTTLRVDFELDDKFPNGDGDPAIDSAIRCQERVTSRTRCCS